MRPVFFPLLARLLLMMAIAVWDWVRILTDPDPDELSRMIRVGQRVTWPKVRASPAFSRLQLTPRPRRSR